ncbi:MAG: DUF2793 domain-containing protein [Caulobacteraceae bacterium]
MSDDATPRLDLPYLAASQAQKHVTLNQSLARLDGLVQLSVVSLAIAAQPASPSDGALYILPASPTGAEWSLHAANTIMRFEAGAWTAITPSEGFVAWVADEDQLYAYTGAAWAKVLSDALQNIALLGLGTTADSTNPFSAKLNKALWTAKTAAESGDGDLRFTFTKETAADTASTLFQTGYSGRAEAGLIGDDDFTLKVSPDGAAWTTAFSVDKTTGQVTAAKGLLRRQLDVFTASGSYAVPAWAKRLKIVCIGGGAGGGSGASGDNSANRFGGGGGGAGGVAWEELDVSGLSSSLTVTIGTGGAGGTGALGAAGSTGGDGNASSVQDGSAYLVRAAGGTGGPAGDTAAQTASAGGSGEVLGNAGGTSASGATASAGLSTSFGRGPGGGGGGGCITTAGTQRTGGSGGNGYTIGFNSRRANGGTGGGIGVAGTAGSDKVWTEGAGGGGGGGGASSTAAGGAGGAGGLPGGGGGGGGGSRSAFSSGAGGAGGRGEVRIVAYG